MEEARSEQQGELIDLSEVLHNFPRTLRRTWALILVLAAALGSLQYFRAERSYRPVYTASATFSVSSGVSSATNMIDTAKYYDSQAVAQIVSSFQDIVNSEAMRERILQDLGTPYINGSITTSAVGDTNIFSMQVTSLSLIHI